MHLQSVYTFPKGSIIKGLVTLLVSLSLPSFASVSCTDDNRISSLLHPVIQKQKELRFKDEEIIHIDVYPFIYVYIVKDKDKPVYVHINFWDHDYLQGKNLPLKDWVLLKIVPDNYRESAPLSLRFQRDSVLWEKKIPREIKLYIVGINRKGEFVDCPITIMPYFSSTIIKIGR